MGDITPADVEACVGRYREQLAPATLKGLQLRIGAVYRWATRKAKVYRGENPVLEAAKVEVPERQPRCLTVEQLEQLFEAAGSDRVIHVFAALTGMRKGEVAGLRWELVDLTRGLITVRYSYNLPRTKGRKDRIIPIHPDLAPALQQLRAEATSKWVFPNPVGGMRTEAGWDAAKNFKAALVRAGLVKGYEYNCVTRGKRESCGFREVRPVKKPACCPQCGMRLWPTGIPLDFAFKDLRSTFATHLAELGDLRLVQRLLGHARPDITERAYAAARVDYLRQGVEGLRLTRDKSGTQGGKLRTGEGLLNGKGE
nr:tyrosine-type recombinase/integrase [Corallococcus soli]